MNKGSEASVTRMSGRSEIIPTDIGTAPNHLPLRTFSEGTPHGPQPLGLSPRCSHHEGMKAMGEKRTSSRNTMHAFAACCCTGYRTRVDRLAMAPSGHRELAASRRGSQSGCTYCSERLTFRRLRELTQQGTEVCGVRPRVIKAQTPIRRMRPSKRSKRLP